MFPAPLRRLLKAHLERLGYEVRRKDMPSPVIPPQRASWEGALAHVASVGWRPGGVIDVGAAYGDFSVTCARLFPDARYLLVEALEEYRPFLDAVIGGSPKMSLALVAAGRTSGAATLHVHRDWEGSSMFREAEGHDVDGVPRVVPIRTLDQIQADEQLPPPLLAKLDVQGAELDVLQGASELLKVVDYLWMEVSLFRFFVGGPQLHEVVAYMHSRGFVPYDIGGLKYRPIDGALAQVDLAFVKEDSAFRTCHSYASTAQRLAQDAQFMQSRRARERALAGSQ